MTEESIEDKIANADIDEKIRYCYIVTSEEIPIVGVWSSYDEALEEAGRHMKDQGVISFDLQVMNKEISILKPIEYDTYEKTNILRYIVR